MGVVLFTILIGVVTIVLGQLFIGKLGIGAIGGHGDCGCNGKRKSSRSNVLAKV